MLKKIIIGSVIVGIFSTSLFADLSSKMEERQTNWNNKVDTKQELRESKREEWQSNRNAKFEDRLSNVEEGSKKYNKMTSKNEKWNNQVDNRQARKEARSDKKQAIKNNKRDRKQKRRLNK